ncbi:hypothetical protein MMH89_01920 [Candidatus Comchoanobacter bicostacola]|uniref:Uncharacterized protein n=1 Tax=Candidatus Comchoanobacter bicostacola TaxID=2919598 RepID=A0ABY5DLB0_9GAMM|nr:hypothetical protein [Candidatus Comchoanobacter bicostacola]UTC24905.1 hypothetical protein MMH89_01920 [Candidatus Comchoanobacter bicostacola]
MDYSYITEKISKGFEHLIASSAIGFFLAQGFFKVMNIGLQALFIPTIASTQFMLLYALYLTSSLPGKVQNNLNQSTKLRMMTSIRHLWSKLKLTFANVMSFSKTICTFSMGYIILIYLKINLLLAAPSLGLFIFGYIWCCSLIGPNAADVIFNPFVMIISAAHTMMQQLFTGHVLLIFQIVSIFTIFALYFYKGEQAHSTKVYNAASITNLIVLLLNNLTFISVLTPKILPILGYLNCNIGRLGQSFTTMYTSGSVIQNALPEQQPDKGVDHVREPKGSRKTDTADNLPRTLTPP